VTTNDSDAGVLRRGTDGLGQEAPGAYDIESCDTEDAAGVKNTSLFEGASDDGNGRVDGVRDDKNVGFWRNAGNGCGEVSDDGGICLVTHQILNPL
jgi:hypothetical protein